MLIKQVLVIYQGFLYCGTIHFQEEKQQKTTLLTKNIQKLLSFIMVKGLFLSLLQFVFGFNTKDRLKGQLQHFDPQNKINPEFFLSYAQSLAILIKDKQSKHLQDFFTHFQQDNAKQFNQAQRLFPLNPMQIFFEKISVILKEAYKIFQNEDLLLVLQQLSLKLRIQCNLIKCNKNPESIELIQEYSESCLYLLHHDEVQAFLKAKLEYFYSTGQLDKANIIKNERLILQMLTCDPKNMKELPQVQPTIETFKRLIFNSFETSRLYSFTILLRNFKIIYPHFNEFVNLELIETIYSGKNVSPQLYVSLLSRTNSSALFYNLSMSIRFEQEYLYDKSEFYLRRQQEVSARSRDFYIRAAYFYYMIKKYQLCLDYTYKYNLFVENPSELNVVAIISHLMLGNMKQAQIRIRALEEIGTLQENYDLFILYSRLGRVEKAIKIGESLANKKEYNYLQVLIILLVNYQRSGQQLSTIIEEIARQSQSERPRFTRHRKQFASYYFMCKFCYEKVQYGMFKRGVLFAQKAYEILEDLQQYSQEGANRLKTMLLDKKEIDIEHQLHI